MGFKEESVIGYVVAGYAVVGVVVALVGPGRREIRGKISSTCGWPIIDEVAGRVEPPDWRVIVFGVTLTLGAVLLWPILLSRIVNRWTAERRSQREWEKRVAQGLEFSLMGGAGVISCQDCGFRQEITSFTHGATSGPDACCDEGFQCLSCGKFVSVHREGNPPDDPVPRCECGGELSRDHFLFCPKCRSRKLRYAMAYIT
jgi:hypothetical protein